MLYRITTPQLTRVEYGKLTLSDTQVFNTALDFFSAPPTAKAEIAQALADLGYASESTPTASPE